MATAWAFAVISLSNTEAAAGAAFVCSVAGYLALSYGAKRWRNKLVDVEPLALGKRQLAVMGLVSIPFCLISVYLRIAGDTYLDHQTLGAILNIQALLEHYQASITVKALTASVTIGFVLMILWAWLQSDLAAFTWLSKQKMRTGKLFSTISLIILCFSSFSIVLGPSGASLTTIVKDRVEAEKEALVSDLKKLEAHARIVFGENLLAAIPGVEPALPAIAHKSNPKLQQLSDDDSSNAQCQTSYNSDQQCSLVQLIRVLGIAEAEKTKFEREHPAGQNTPILIPNHPSVAEEMSALRSAFSAPQQSAHAHTPEDPELYKQLVASDVKGAAETVCKNEEACAPVATPTTLKDVLPHVIDAILGLTGWKLPEVELREPLGEFIQKMMSEVSTEPTQDALKQWTIDAVVKLVNNCGAHACTVKLDLPHSIARAATKLGPSAVALRADMTDRLRKARADLAILQPPASRSPRSFTKGTTWGPLPNDLRDSTGTGDPTGPNDDPIGDCLCGTVVIGHSVHRSQCPPTICRP